MHAISKQMLCPRCWGSEVESDGLSCNRCKGMGVISDVQLSKHFQLHEFLYSRTAVRNRIPNEPTHKNIKNLALLCTRALEPIRERFGPIIVTSGLRVTALNTAVGGSRTSAHRTGLAADIQGVRSNATFRAIMTFLASNSSRGGPWYDQAIYEGPHIHIGIRETIQDNRMQLLTKFYDQKKGRFVITAFDPKDPRLT
jgi:zinc D-Ala-D-Ala carboxypeptidase